jgi:hypothetical protein
MTMARHTATASMWPEEESRQVPRSPTSSKCSIARGAWRGGGDTSLDVGMRNHVDLTGKLDGWQASLSVP